MSDARIRILIADDHFLIRDGLRWRMSADPTLECVGEVSDGAGLEAALTATTPDILVLDLNMPNFPEPATFVRQAKKTYPALNILILTGHDDAEIVFEMLTAEADGYILKDDMKEVLLPAIQQVARGQGYYSQKIASQFVRQVSDITNQHHDAPIHEELTPRESEVLDLIAQGLSNSDIATRLNIQPRTVTNHITHIYSKLSLKTRTEAICYVLKQRAAKKLLG
jgi:DNA-binding NarL/FixJ family response regulator